MKKRESIEKKRKKSQIRAIAEGRIEERERVRRGDLLLLGDVQDQEMKIF